MRLLLVVAFLLMIACAGSKDGRPSAACGLAALAGPTALLGQFGVPDQTIVTPPGSLPERVVVRHVAGEAYPAIVGRAEAEWIVGVQGQLPSNVQPGFGVLIQDLEGRTRGVMLYEGTPVEAAPELGTVSLGNTTVPLIGIRLDPSKVEDPRCPLFPDSVIQ